MYILADFIESLGNLDSLFVFKLCLIGYSGCFGFDSHFGRSKNYVLSLSKLIKTFIQNKVPHNC
ncbi:hypothetical protein IV87_GL000487 [Pediococcus ethanolidurans]|uniref:Uncharacterized protein n=1 Tax=Pediococcus ethanolidurans TaxID=319653 RepID=A0A0R2JY30_9LACO|nr:hypothetical protein IV87_GL000487 [Pediococcus ethanolidurans]GEN95467.1 hypothetical protein PET01_15170 [Pediococcus ethanolidurans]SER73112.1 hypothetical protein SAMN04487973_11447 [Pediococcus ethanolidurans]